MSCTDRYDWEINVGESVAWGLTIRDGSGNYYNLSGYNAKSQIRSFPQGDLILELSNSNGYLIIGPSTGRIDISIPPSGTSGLSPQSANYDLFIIATGNTYSEKIIHGKVDILPSITLI